MQFGLQKANFSFCYKGDYTSRIIDSLKKLAMTAVNSGFDSLLQIFYQVVDWEHI